MSNAPNTIMDIHIWDHAQHIPVPMGGHYDLEPNTSYTLGELVDMNNIFGMRCKAALDRYDPNTKTKYIDANASTNDQLIAHLTMAFAHAHTMPPCPQCRNEISGNNLFMFHPAFPRDEQYNNIRPCFMNKSVATPLNYDINIPSGRLIVGNDLRALVYAEAADGPEGTEETERNMLQHYADVGLLYIYASDHVDIRPMTTSNSYIIGNMPNAAHDEIEDINTFIAQLPESQRPACMEDAPLAHITGNHWAVSAMDGDHFDDALTKFTRKDAQKIYNNITTIDVTPGYYRVTMASSRDVFNGKIATLTRVDDSDAHAIPRANTFSMHAAIDYLQRPGYNDFHPFNVWNDQTEWALGCPAPTGIRRKNTQHPQYSPIPCPIPSMEQLFDLEPNGFDPWDRTNQITDDPAHLFAPIPENIAPEAIACWIAGADASMRAIRHAIDTGDLPAISQHQQITIYHAYNAFRSTLWGAAITNGTSDMVEAYATELMGLIHEK